MLLALPVAMRGADDRATLARSSARSVVHQAMPIHSLLARGFILTGLPLFLALVVSAASAQDSAGPADPPAPPAVESQSRQADFRQEASSPEARELADRVVSSSDNGTFPFIVIDKVQARVYVFDGSGQLRGASSALLGTAVGDDAVPGIGQRKLSTIRSHERITQAGRFVAYLDRDIHGEEVMWVDYETSLSLHRIVKGQPKDRRAERLASPSPLDNRITFGCINVSVAFYDGVVSPLFQRTQGIVYILPETRPAHVVFSSLGKRLSIEASDSSPVVKAASK